MSWHFFCLPCVLIYCTACQTFYQQHQKLANALQQNDYAKAEKQAQKMQKKKNQLLYYLHQGSIAHMQQQYIRSNYLLEKAHRYQAVNNQSWLQASFDSIANTQLKDYQGEIHEILLLYYYKILNFLQLQKYTHALVECRRLDIQLKKLKELYQTNHKKNYTYARDAFIHMLMGIVYQINHAYNDAYIAYKHAIQIYEEDYLPYFDIDIPEQLKQDILYVAYQIGFYKEMAMYERKFNKQYHPPKQKKTKEIICFWHNGLGPIKDTSYLVFLLFKNQAGILHFENEEHQLSFAFPCVGNEGSKHWSEHIKMLKVAFPKYVERNPIYDEASINCQGKKYPLVLVQNIHAIATQVLKQQRKKILAKTLLKLAIKKSSTYMIGQKNKPLAFALDLWYFLTEKTDTRHWQTIPYAIYYTRITVPEDTDTITCCVKSYQHKKEKKWLYNVQGKHTQCVIIHTPVCV